MAGAPLRSLRAGGGELRPAAVGGGGLCPTAAGATLWALQGGLVLLPGGTEGLPGGLLIYQGNPSISPKRTPMTEGLLW